jgi:site-specific DNA-methyltransferase (adenine-specific)
MTNYLYYGDNLQILRQKIHNDTIDLCYIDPPFNSKRTYNQIYNNIGTEDRAQSQAFIDTWIWDDMAIAGYQEILDNKDVRFTKQTIELIKGLSNVLGQGSLLAYLVSMTLRVTEIQRVLKPNGSFYFHCDQTASHYLKLILDGIFCSKGGDFKREIIWSTTDTSGFKSQARNWIRSHDTILYYTKSDDYFFKKLYWNHNPDYIKRFKKVDEVGRKYRDDRPGGRKQYLDETEGKTIGDVWDDIDSFQQASTNPEYLGYPTQKRIAILERIIEASSKKDKDVVILDAYCGCGTTVAAAQSLNLSACSYFPSVALTLCP